MLSSVILVIACTLLQMECAVSMGIMGVFLLDITQHFAVSEALVTSMLAYQFAITLIAGNLKLILYCLKL